MKPDRSKQSSLFRRLVAVRVTRLRAALLLLALFGLLHLLGWRDDTAILSGTLTDHNARLAALRGVLYATLYFAAVIVSPILILAAGLDVLLSRLAKAKPAGQASVEAGRRVG